MNDLDNTQSRAMSDAEAESLAAAAEAFAAGLIRQREVAPGVWRLSLLSRAQVPG